MSGSVADVVDRSPGFRTILGVVPILGVFAGGFADRGLRSVRDVMGVVGLLGSSARVSAGLKVELMVGAVLVVVSSPGFSVTNSCCCSSLMMK